MPGGRFDGRGPVLGNGHGAGLGVVTLGDPLERDTFLGPVTDQRAVDRFNQAVAEARADGTVYTGGENPTDGDLARGFYVEPTVVGNLPKDHRLFRDELFVPFTAVAPVDSLDEALELFHLANGGDAVIVLEDALEQMPRRPWLRLLLARLPEPPNAAGQDGLAAVLYEQDFALALLCAGL